MIARKDVLGEIHSMTIVFDVVSMDSTGIYHRIHSFKSQNEKTAYNRGQQYQQQQMHRVIRSKAIAARRTGNQGHDELTPKQDPFLIFVLN